MPCCRVVVLLILLQTSAVEKRGMLPALRVGSGAGYQAPSTSRPLLRGTALKDDQVSVSRTSGLYSEHVIPPPNKYPHRRLSGNARAQSVFKHLCTFFRSILPTHNKPLLYGLSVAFWISGFGFAISWLGCTQTAQHREPASYDPDSNRQTFHGWVTGSVGSIPVSRKIEH